MAVTHGKVHNKNSQHAESRTLICFTRRAYHTVTGEKSLQWKPMLHAFHYMSTPNVSKRTNAD